MQTKVEFANRSNIAQPWQKIAQASKTTGLSQYFLRSGCKDGSIPHICSGTTYMVNVPLLLEQLEAQAKGRCGV